MDRDNEKIWSGVLEGLKLVTSEATFKAYIRHTMLLGITEVGERWVCEVGCPSMHVMQLIEQRYLGQVIEELARITEKKCEIRFKIQSRRAGEQESLNKLPLFEEKKTSDEEYRKARLKPGNTFENYAVGGSNQMAYAAASAVAKRVGSAYNPLFIYGGGGSGENTSDAGDWIRGGGKRGRAGVVLFGGGVYQ